MLKIEKLSVSREGKRIIDGLELSMGDGEVHALMGPNGSGKTTLSYAIMGRPGYECEGKIILDGEDITKMGADERAKRGIFLAFQHPAQIEGISLMGLLRRARKAAGKPVELVKFTEEVKKDAKHASLPESMLSRDLNAGLSGGERKKGEIVQMLALAPKLAILDEIDSGLDVDALRAVAKSVREAKNGKLSLLVITHHVNLLRELKPDFVHIMLDGRITRTGNAKFAKEIEKKGYEWLRESDD
ncbi:MAG: Fe-S cluster assembly ATPase SufC [Candidatus ainarchaeum sp.]|nr:Fe-S cluster assembly ATPase SufC [Candidatus ainarchaeum sp.]